MSDDDGIPVLAHDDPRVPALRLIDAAWAAARAERDRVLAATVGESGAGGDAPHPAPSRIPAAGGSSPSPAATTPVGTITVERGGDSQPTTG
jgi:hypothetical protein